MNALTQFDVPYNYLPKVYIYSRRNRWYWKYLLPDGSWFYCSAGDDEFAARRNCRFKEADLTRGLFTEKELEKIQLGRGSESSFVDAISRYCQNVALDSSPNYVRPMEIDLKASAKMITDLFSVDLISKFKEEHAHRYRDELMSRVSSGDISRVTARNKLNNLKRLFKWLKKRKRIALNPWLEIDAIKLSREDMSRNVSLPKEVYEKLLVTEYSHRFEFPLKEFIRLLFETGVRQGEALHLEVGDVDWETGYWSVGPKVCPTLHASRWSPKYNKRREVYIPEKLREVLKPFVDRAEQNTVIGYTAGKDGKKEAHEAKFVFSMIDTKLSGKRKKVYRRVDNVNAAWNALFFKAGLGRMQEVKTESSKKYRKGIKYRPLKTVNYTRHDLRRGYNEATRRAGMSISDRCALLGHDASVNRRHYKGEDEVSLRAVSNKLDEIFSSESGSEEASAPIG